VAWQVSPPGLFGRMAVESALLVMIMILTFVGNAIGRVGTVLARGAGGA
jgi:hypothetical protein